MWRNSSHFRGMWNLRAGEGLGPPSRVWARGARRRQQILKASCLPRPFNLIQSSRPGSRLTGPEKTQKCSRMGCNGITGCESQRGSVLTGEKEASAEKVSLKSGDRAPSQCVQSVQQRWPRSGHPISCPWAPEGHGLAQTPQPLRPGCRYNPSELRWYHVVGNRRKF